MRDKPIPHITVTRQSETKYLVRIEEGASWTEHVVTVTPDDMERYAPSGTPPETLLKASFEFLLEHEPKESILPRFRLPVIEQYFQEYPRKMRDKL
jgi:hypothetical protein